MSRLQEANNLFLRTGDYVYNMTIESNERLNRIVNSITGMEGIKLDAKEIKSGVYDFIISFEGIRDDKTFSEKLGELHEILMDDFPGYKDLGMQKFKNWPKPSVNLEELRRIAESSKAYKGTY